MKFQLLLAYIFLINSALVAQYSISGHIYNEKDEALIGASVFLVGSDYATLTDQNGRFEISGIPEEDYSFKVTYLGYKSHVEDIYIDADMSFDVFLYGTIFKLDEVKIVANSLDEDAPFSYSEMSRTDIEMQTLAQDMPILLRHNTSVVTTSDAGNGIGYTSMRLRGSDQTRINVTINGVPLNDAESHNVFWVDLPDFSASVENLQIQRGVGPSTNGAASFGGTLGLNTSQPRQNPFVQLEGGVGSFNTNKLSATVGTGLIENQFNIEGRYSIIKSDGYVDRASSDLKSWFFSASKIGETSAIKFNAFGGTETTYQSWYGTPVSRVTGDEEALRAHYFNNLGVSYLTPQDSINLFDSDRRYNYYTYENQVDDYRQTHYQLIYTKQASDKLTFNTTLHYTRGLGYFEEFKVGENLADYGLDPIFLTETDPVTNIIDTIGRIDNSDLVRRRWLDNHFYGAIVNAALDINEDANLLAGIAYNRYDGAHFGRIIDLEEDPLFTDFFRTYYESDALKTDLNAYIKYEQKLTKKLNLFADVQVRNIGYTAMGLNDDQANIAIDTSFTFLNPKLGLSYALTDSNQIYASWAVAQREPVRSDFIDAIGTRVPSHESLQDFELGYRRQGKKLSYQANLYYMLYDNQLVLTGALNNSGAPVRTNVKDSYRLGLELTAQYQINDVLLWQPNLTVSQNKIGAYDELLFDYFTETFSSTTFEDTDIAYSPTIITGSQLQYNLNDHVAVAWFSKYIGRQYLDNTSTTSKSLDPYWVNDFILQYSPKIDGIQNINFKLMLNNILDEQYSANGYTFSYLYDGALVEEVFLYPQAGFNFLLGASVTF